MHVLLALFREPVNENASVYGRFIAGSLLLFAVLAAVLPAGPRREHEPKKAALVTPQPLVNHISLGAALSLHRTGRSIFVDARPPAAWERSRIASALTPDAASALLADEARRRQVGAIVVYCNAGCSSSNTVAASFAKSFDRPIYIYKGGWDEWQSLGLPTE